MSLGFIYCLNVVRSITRLVRKQRFFWIINTRTRRTKLICMLIKEYPKQRPFWVKSITWSTVQSLSNLLNISHLLNFVISNGVFPVMNIHQVVYSYFICFLFIPYVFFYTILNPRKRKKSKTLFLLIECLETITSANKTAWPH